MPKEIIQNIVREQIEPNMNSPAEEWSTDHLPGLMESVDGFTPKFGLSLFTAATQYLCTVTQHEEKLEKMKFFTVEYGLRLDENNKAKLSACVTIDHSNCTLTVYKNEAEAKHIIAELEKEGEEVDMSKKSLQNCVFLGEETAAFEGYRREGKVRLAMRGFCWKDQVAREVKDLRFVSDLCEKWVLEKTVLTIRRLNSLNSKCLR